ncbi:calcium-binding protein [Limimaricola cinnabarinus]|uniref:calcium-binding protein n=1 Tax=Limimaricola cinnabarinus TaxID=1125964 RepID=UPI002492DA6D|nr:calcium-binding protein [Limimaricola cinnabarinus]
MSFITSDLCEEVEICDPNEIEQECLPSGEDLVCEYTINIDLKDYVDDKVMRLLMSPAEFSSWMKWDANFELKKMVNTDGSEYWHAISEGSSGKDYLSGLSFLSHLESDSAGTKPDPSVYVGDLIHFDLEGAGGDDTVEGAHNADRLRGGSGNDEIIAHDGDDRVFGGSGNDEIDGGAGNDLVWGSSGNDDIDGGSGDDLLKGGTGDDEIDGGSGNDNIYGESGNDTLSGNDGNDYMEGGSGQDEMYGGDGDDCMDGGDGDDCMDGGDGDDLMTGGLGNDVMNGGEGNDKLDGNEGDDEVCGGDGDDLVAGGDGNDVVRGGDGDDIVRGGLGEDELWGDDGCDQFVFCEIDFNCADVIMDFDSSPRGDQIDLTQLDIDTVRVQMSGLSDVVGLDLIVDGEAVQQIEINSGIGADLQSVFERDSTFGTDEGALVQIGSGVRVDLPSVSVLHSDDGMFF